MLGGVLLFLTVFWLGFTHLQGRFYLPAVPIGAMLLAQVRWGRWAPAALGLVLLAAVPGWLSLHRLLSAHLYGATGQAGGMIEALGGPNGDANDVAWLTDVITEGLPPDAPLLLAGDAKAFWYAIPMKRLRYRTIFDAGTGGDRGVKEAWGVGAGPPGEWVLVDPAELRRYVRTYQPFPPPPPDWTTRPEWDADPPRPFLIAP